MCEKKTKDASDVKYLSDLVFPGMHFTQCMHIMLIRSIPISYTVAQQCMLN